jgi:hypothetical protein|tara:strand:+ start:1070 stop:1510 length:441 start_codon:yes stop_codon:yes gene_type:complete
MVKTKNQNKVTKTDMRPMAQRNADAKVKAQADLAQRDFTAHLARGTSGANLGMTVTLGADVDSAIAQLPKQCKLLCQYLAKQGGTATFQVLNDYADTADGVEYWGKGTIPYEQSVAKIASHYMAMLLGEKAWSKKLGKQEIIRVVA